MYVTVQTTCTLVSWVAITSKVNGGLRREELELVMGGADRNIETIAGNLNGTEEAAREYATTIAGYQPMHVRVTTTDRALDLGTVFSRIAQMMASSEFSNTWATATAISLEKDVEWDWRSRR